MLNIIISFLLTAPVFLCLWTEEGPAKAHLKRSWNLAHVIHKMGAAARQERPRQFEKRPLHLIEVFYSPEYLSDKILYSCISYVYCIQVFYTCFYINILMYI